MEISLNNKHPFSSTASLLHMSKITNGLGMVSSTSTVIDAICMDRGRIGSNLTWVEIENSLNPG